MDLVWDYSYDGVMRSYEQSLLRLGLDTIDGLLIHDPEPEIHGDRHAERMRDMAGSGIKALEELKRGGQIKAIGMGLNATASLETIAPMVKLDFVIVAMPYTLLDQSALANGMQRCVEQGISIVIGSPYASGILATGTGSRRALSLWHRIRGHSEQGPADPEGLRGTWRESQGGGAAVSAGASGGRFGHSRRSAARRGHGKHRHGVSADSAGVLGVSQDRGADRPTMAPVPA